MSNSNLIRNIFVERSQTYGWSDERSVCRLVVGMSGTFGDIRPHLGHVTPFIKSQTGSPPLLWRERRKSLYAVTWSKSRVRMASKQNSNFPDKM